MRYEVRQTFISVSGHYGEAWIIYDKLKHEKLENYYVHEDFATWEANRLNGIKENLTIESSGESNKTNSDTPNELGSIDFDSIDLDSE